MPPLVIPENVTKAVNLTAKTIALRWQNKNGSSQTAYEFQFTNRADPTKVASINFSVSAIAAGASQKADLIFTSTADVAKLDDYYAELRAVNPNKSTETSAWAREQLTWAIGGSLSLTVAARPLILSSNDGIDPGVYAGKLDFRDSPISLVALANQFLAEIKLSLPSSFPDIVFYYLSAYCKTTQPKYLQVNALASVNIDNPFGLANVTIGFKYLMLAIGYGTRPDATKTETTYKSLSLSGDIVYKPKQSTDEPTKFGSAVIILGNEANVLGVEIVQQISAAGILSALLSIDIPPEVAFFLPTFRPLSPGKPIRLYKASKSNSYDLVQQDGSIQTINYQAGFNLDQLAINVVGYDFYVSLQIATDQKFLLTAFTDAIALFGVVIIKGRTGSESLGPKLTVNSAKDSISLEGGLLFFPKTDDPKGGEELDFAFSYTKATQEFRGEVAYIGTILNVKNPSLGFSWSKTHGFNITKYPIDIRQLADALNWAQQLQSLANSDTSACAKACGEITGLLFDQAITTRFAFKYKPAPASKPKYVGVVVTGTYTLNVLSLSIEVPLELTLEVNIPTGFDDLGSAILNSLLANVKNVALALWNNKVALAELLGAVTLKMAIDAAKKAACRLSCQAGEEALKKSLQAALDAAAKAAAELAATSIEAAADVVVAAGGVISAILAFITWLFGLSDDQKRQKAEAERKQNEANEKIRQYLHIASHSAVYHESENHNKTIEIAWSEVNGGTTPTKGSIYYDVTINQITTQATVLGQSIQQIKQVYSKRYRQDERGASVPVDNGKNLFCGKEYSVVIKAYYQTDNLYSGDEVSNSVTTPIMQQPAPIASFNTTTEENIQKGMVEVSWQVVGPTPTGLTGAPLHGYTAQLHNITKNTFSAVQTLVKVNNVIPTSCRFQVYHLPTSSVEPDANDKFEVSITANSTDPDLDNTGKSTVIVAPLGVGFMQVGYNFKVN